MPREWRSVNLSKRSVSKLVGGLTRRRLLLLLLLPFLLLLLLLLLLGEDSCTAAPQSIQLGCLQSHMCAQDSSTAAPVER
jgi:hypothetical protein